MFIGDDLAWVHFPKTAGTTTKRMLALFPEVGRLEPRDDPDTHLTFADRAEQIEGRSLAMNFRRLPYWVISYANYTVTRSDTTAQRSAIQAVVDSASPDGKLDRYLGGDRYRVDHWLRTEHLLNDLEDLLSNHTRIGLRRRRHLRSIPRRNELSYGRELREWYDAGSLADLYERNPRWTSIETELYGDRLHL